MVTERNVSFAELAPGLSVDWLFKTSESPPPPRPPGRGDLVDLGVAPGLTSWSLWRFEPDAEVRMHHTDTVDFDVVVEGAVELILDDGTHRLEAGDCAVIAGVDHGWRAGSNGCITSATAIGTLRADTGRPASG